MKKGKNLTDKNKRTFCKWDIRYRVPLADVSVVQEVCIPAEGGILSRGDLDRWARSCDLCSLGDLLNDRRTFKVNLLTKNKIYDLNDGDIPMYGIPLGDWVLPETLNVSIKGQQCDPSFGTAPLFDGRCIWVSKPIRIVNGSVSMIHLVDILASGCLEGWEDRFKRLHGKEEHGTGSDRTEGTGGSTECVEGIDGASCGGEE